MQEATNKMYKDIIDSIPGLVYQMRFRKDGSRYWSYLSPMGIEILGLEKDLIGQSDIAVNSSKEELFEEAEDIIADLEQALNRI